MDTPELAYTWTASSTSGSDAAVALMRWSRGHLGFWAIGAVLWLMIAALIYVGLDEGTSTAFRLVWTPVFGLVFAALTLLGLHFMSYLANRARLNRTFAAGAVVESGFSADAFRIRTRDSDVVRAWSAVRSVHATDRWVIIVEHGAAVARMVPRDLFPDEQLTRAHQAP